MRCNPFRMSIKASKPDTDAPSTDIFIEEPEGVVDETLPPVSSSTAKKKVTTTKIIVWICLLNGLAWVWCSYVLAAMGREVIAESLSQVALTEIIGVVLVYAIKSLIENLSKNNNWPDKHGSDSTDSVG